MRLWKKCFDPDGPDGILRLALETFLSLRVLRPTGGCSSPSPKTNVSPFAYLLAVVVLLGAVLGVGLKSARAEIIAYTDQSGRRIYVNVEDQELRAVTLAGGVPAALRLMEQRRQGMPGIESHIDFTAKRHAVDPRLVRAIIQVESAWNPRARSRKGALGLMQLMPDTGARFGARDPLDPRQNIAAGVLYLRYLLDRFENDMELALAAYNAGPTAVEEANGVPPYRETRQYLERVQAVYGRLSARVEGTERIYRVADDQGRTVFTNE